MEVGGAGKMLMKQEQLSSLVDEIYTAAADPGHWEAVARRIQSAIGGHSVNLVFWNRADRRLNFAFSTTHSPEDLIRWERDCRATDELLALHQLAEPGDCWLTQDYFDEKTLRSLSVVEGFFDEFDCHLFNCNLIYRGDGAEGVLAVARSLTDKPFSPEEKHLMQQLAPHLQRAAAFNKLLVDAQQQSPMAADLLDKLSMAVLLVDEQGKIRVRNRHAEALYSRGVLVTNAGGLHVCDHKASQKLEAEIKRIAKAEGTLTEGMHAVVPFADSQGRRHTACCLPYRATEQQADFFGSRLRAVVLITEQACVSDIPLEDLCQAYGITKAESRVLHLLLLDLSTREVAEKLCVSRETVRYHLKNLYQKTGTHRQSELLGLVIKTLGMLDFS